MGPAQTRHNHKSGRMLLLSLPLLQPALPPLLPHQPMVLSLPTPMSLPSTPTSTPSRMTTPTTTSAQRRRETDMLPRDLTMSAFLMVVSRRSPTLSTVMVDMLPHLVGPAAVALGVPVA